MTHPQLQARKPLSQAPEVAEVFAVLGRRLSVLDVAIATRIGVIIDGPEPAEYVVDFAVGQVRGGNEWSAATEDPELDVLVRVDGGALREAMAHGTPPVITLVRGDARAMAPLIALLRSAV